jgi:hypothetical protein
MDWPSITALAQQQEYQMSDDKSKTGNQDRLRINVNEDYELRHWSKRFGVTPEQLKAAVQKVGVMAADVEKELKKK